MSSDSVVVVDCAGGPVGGARRYLGELEKWLARSGAPVVAVGRGRRVSAAWLVGREFLAQRVPCDRVVAINNICFLAPGKSRTVLVRNALHFLAPGETGWWPGLGPVLLQGRVIKTALRRADRVVVPSEAMAERVQRFGGVERSRLEVLPHPVTPLGNGLGDRLPRRILCPVLAAPYKRLGTRLPDAVLALERLMSGGGDPIELVLTLDPSTLQALGIADRPWLVVNGPLLPEQLGPLQASAGVIFFPCELESFGFPLAEARVNRQPVVAPDTALSREVAGDALVPYHPGDVNSLAAAFDEALGLTLPPLRENPFDPGRYFTCLFEFQS